MRSATQSGLRVLGATLALSAPACEWIPPVPDAELLRLDRALTLEIAQADSRKSGTATFTLKLLNHSTEIASACLGPGRAVSYTASGTSGVSATLVDHPGCMKEFTLQPGREMTWREDIEVAVPLRRDVEVEVDLEIVNPRRCGASGCSAIRLRSNTYVIPGIGLTTTAGALVAYHATFHAAGSDVDRR